MQNK
ncbi:2-dehydro-3-deoxyphosphooctonate aldolase, partial [Haemophilus influenzae]|jgi:hypothetical protein